MWHGALNDLNNNIEALGNQFQKPILIAETAYPFTLQWNDNTNNILGFETQMPPTPAYKASGTYTGALALSNQGLHAEGALDYLQSHTVCPDILFFPLQASGRATTFAVEEGTTGMGYPYASGTSNPFVWMPYEDNIRAETGKCTANA